MKRHHLPFAWFLPCASGGMLAAFGRSSMNPSNQASSKVSPSLNRHLDRYVIAATAAGVSWLALAQPANAEIVYTQVNQVIPSDTTFNLDLNHDGIVDFES
jgi:hypothetical protein